MYAYNKSNVAYDLSRFDVEEREKKPKNAPHIKMHATSVAKSGNWFVTIVLVTFAAVVAFFFISSKAALSEVTTQISSKTTELQEAKSENVRLQAQLDNMVTLSKVEEMAISELGLKPMLRSLWPHFYLLTSMCALASQPEDI